MGQLMNKSDRVNAFKALQAKVSSNKQTIAQMMGSADTARFMQMALQYCANSPKLLQCDPAEVLFAIKSAAELKLEIGGRLGHAYLVPFFNKKKRKMECQMITGYQGLIDLAYRGGVRRIISAVVYENDSFVYQLGTDPKLEHKPAMADRGQVLGGYAVAWVDSGDPVFEFVTKEDVEKIRRAGGGGTPWKDWFDQMVRKTAIRRLSKFLPKSVDKLVQALELDAAAEAGTSQREIVREAEIEFLDHDEDAGVDDTDPIEQVAEELSDGAPPQDQQPSPPQDQNVDSDGVPKAGAARREYLIRALMGSDDPTTSDRLGGYQLENDYKSLSEAPMRALNAVWQAIGKPKPKEE